MIKYKNIINPPQTCFHTSYRGSVLLIIQYCSIYDDLYILAYCDDMTHKFLLSRLMILSMLQLQTCD